jgi:hypothetical protein
MMEETPMPEIVVKESLADAVAKLEREYVMATARLATVNSEIHASLSREKAYLGIINAISACGYEEIRAAADIYAAWGAPDSFDRALRKLMGGPMEACAQLCDHLLEVIRAAAVDKMTTSKEHRERLRALKIQRDKKTGDFRLGTEIKGRFKHGGEEAAELERAMKAGR